MIWLPAAIISCTAGGAPCGISASPFGRTFATAPGVIGPVTGTHPEDPPAGIGAVDDVVVAAAPPWPWPVWVYCATSWVTCAISGG